MAQRNWPFFMVVLVCLWSHSAAHTEYESLQALKAQTSTRNQQEAVEALIQRKIGARASDFIIEIDTSLGTSGKDTFTLSSENGGKIKVAANGGIAASMGFYYYVKQFCNCHVSWAGDQLSLPTTLPPLEKPITVTANDMLRYYQNVCTVSYSFVWWTWERWQQEIDWMAMQGINFPLAFNAQEAIWQKVLLSLGFSPSDIDDFLSGPAFLAWFRMGNIYKWGGPLTNTWHTLQVSLQHQILTQMRSLGMTPILPAFAGHVPKSILKVFPNASVTKLSSWGHFNSTYTQTFLLNFTDPLFHKFGEMFLKEYIAEFGTDHAYNTDLFNEMTPSSGESAFLAGAGKAVYNAMVSVDPKAIWVMQGWLFRNSGYWTLERAKALLTSVPLGSMVVLDLNSENSPVYTRLQSYFGQPFIWCMLHDFGGANMMYGAVTSVNEGPFSGRKFTSSSMVGIGLTPEGINQNNVIYEFMMENAWRNESRNISQWFLEYPTKRYGQENKNASIAWQYLKKSVYNSTDGSDNHGHGKVIVTRRPSTKLVPDIWYDAQDLFMAVKYISNASHDLGASNLFRYDLIDVTKQSLSVSATYFYKTMMTFYDKRNISSFRQYSKEFLQTLDEMETVLSTDKHFLLGDWLESAKALGSSQEEKDLYEYNARNQITLWGPTGNILDYANKQWSGLMKDYYKPRWELFIQELDHSLTKNTTFNQSQFDSDVFLKVEQPFTFSKKVYPTAPQGNAIYTVNKIVGKYRNLWKEQSEFFHNLKIAKNENKPGDISGYFSANYL